LISIDRVPAVNMMTKTPFQAVDPGSDHLEPDDFRRVAAFVSARTGIRLTEAKRIMVESRLRRRARARGCSTLGEYVAGTLGEALIDEEEIVHLINVITTNKTDFFREPAHFDFITNVVLPEIAESGREGKFWSAACSTGAEPYTLAMVLADYSLRRPDFRWSIAASDISTEVLATARRGIYPAEMMDPVPEADLRRYVMSANDPGRGEVRIVPELRAAVCFSRVNLIDPRWPVDHDFDLIMCRNLLIYFDRESQGRVVERLISHLRPGGWLILGHSDGVSGFDLPLRSLGRSIFKRV